MMIRSGEHAIWDARLAVAQRRVRQVQIRIVVMGMSEAMRQMRAFSEALKQASFTAREFNASMQRVRKALER